MGMILMTGSGGGGANLKFITAKASDILLDKIGADQKGKQVIGTMPNNRAISGSLNCGELYSIPEGYHDGNGKIIANDLASQTPANAMVSQILSGQTAWVNGSLLTGEMIDRTIVDDIIGGINSDNPSVAIHKGSNAQIGTTVNSNESLFAIQPPTGYYNGSYVGIPIATVASVSGISADIIKKGCKVLGITGSYQGYVDTPLYLYQKSTDTWTNMSGTGLTITEKSIGTSSTVTRFYSDTSNGIVWGVNGRSSSSYYIIGRTVGTVNLTDYSELILTNCGWAGNTTSYNSTTKNCAYVGVSTDASLTSASFSAFAQINPAGSSDFLGNRSITVSNLSGSYYIYFYAAPVAANITGNLIGCYMVADSIYLIA